MNAVKSLVMVLHWLVSAPLVAQETSWIKALKDRDQRGTLQDAFQLVRGDSGKWNDEPIFQHSPPIARKPANVSLDNWADQLAENGFQLTSGDDNWLLLRTRQLDDNDRVWIEQIERNGNQFTVTVSQAVWQGRYFKNFTQYNVYGVNLGKLEPGKYQAKWIIKPLTFSKFSGSGKPQDNVSGKPQDNWPADERPADKDADDKPTELTIGFTIPTVSP